MDLLLLSLFVSYPWSSGLYFCTSCDLFFYSPVGSFVRVYSIWQGSGQRADDTSSTACRERLILVHTFFIGLQVPLPALFAHTPRGLSDCLLSLLSSCVIFCLHCIHLSARLPPAFQQNVIAEAVCHIQIWGYQSHFNFFIVDTLYCTLINGWKSLCKTAEYSIFKDGCS